MLEMMPQTITGPATVNIFTHMPNMMPSCLYSMALEHMLFAKPVIGTIVPAPANLAMSSNTPIPVKMQVINIKITSIQAPSSVSVISGKKFAKMSLMACPRQQMSPPTQNELKSVGQILVVGDFVETYAKYFLFLSLLSIISPQTLLPTFDK